MKERGYEMTTHRRGRKILYGVLLGKRYCSKGLYGIKKE
jgi:hypothetical protein